MSFVWKAPRRLKTPEQCAAEMLEVAKARGLNDFAAVLATMCVAQESDFWCPWNRKDQTSHNYAWDSESDDGRSVAYFQQQNGRAGDTLPVGDRDNWWGTMASRMDLKRSCDEFLSRLPDDYMSGLGNPSRSGQLVQQVQRSAYPDAYAKHYDRAVRLVGQAATGRPGGEVVGFSGDPVWLEQVLREALGPRLVVEDGWAERGTGGVMGDIWGVLMHHTGNSRETVAVIRDGRNDLAGPLSQCLIKPDGKCHLIAVGPCNHAGIGDYGPLHDNGNQRLIGLECAWPTKREDLPKGYDPNERWPDAQIITMRDTATAIVKRLGYGPDRVIAHKEYARARQGKWDPGNLDMNWFRAEVAKDLLGAFDPKPGPEPSPPQPGPALPPDYAKEVWDQLRIEWPQLGGQTLVNAIGQIRDAVLEVDDYARWKAGQPKLESVVNLVPVGETAMGTTEPGEPKEE